MSRGPKNVTTTTETAPPDFLLGPLTTAVNAAENQFTGSQSTGGARGSIPPGFPGSQRILGGATASGTGPTGLNFGGFGSGDFPTPFGGVQNNPFTGANGLIGQSQSLTGQTLAGDFLRPESNPFLQGTFNRAADLTRGRLDTEFAGAGRNLGASFPARSDELQTLASNIFGGNFQAERDRQVSAVDQSQGLDPLNLFINRLAGIIPGAGGSTSSTQPVFRTGLF